MQCNCERHRFRENNPALSFAGVASAVKAYMAARVEAERRRLAGIDGGYSAKNGYVRRD